MAQTNSRSINGLPADLAYAGYALLLFILVGLTIFGISPYLADEAQGYVDANLTQNASGGLVLAPTVGGEAEHVGITTGDVLLAINGAPVPSGTSVDKATQLLTGKLGAVVTLTVRSPDGSQKTVSVILSKRYLDALASIGLNNTQLTSLTTGLESILDIAVIAISLWIFLRNRQDWLALLAAGLVVVLPAGIGVVNFPLAGARQLGLFFPYEFIRSLALGLGLLFLFVFPTGRFFPSGTRWVALAGGVYGIVFWLFSPVYPSLWLTWVWVAFFLVGVYALARRAIQDSTPGEKKQMLWLLYGTIAVIVVFSLSTIYDGLPGSLVSWGTWIILDTLRNALTDASLIFLALSLARAISKTE
ncbi:MAG: PDZ domain-containing protein [Anaerolineales bacterium]